MDLATLSGSELLRHLAIHEAAHAVVGTVLGLEWVDVSIADTPTTHPAGDGQALQLGRALWTPDTVVELAEKHLDAVPVMYGRVCR